MIIFKHHRWKMRKAKTARHFSETLQKLMLLLVALSISILSLNAQSTPPGADTNAECGADCWDLFNWSTVQDGSGNNIPNYAEGIASNNSCNTIIDATAEYTGADSNGPDLTGNFIGANLQGISTDNWLLGFGTPLTSPVIEFFGLRTNTEVLITDCNGNEITATCISSCATALTFTSGVGWSGDAAYSLQLDGTYDCINIDVNIVTSNDAYTFSVGTCLGANPLPACADCGMDDFEYIRLANSSGTGTGATADVELNNVLVGNATLVYSDLTINEDLSGTAFGAFADGDAMEETFILQIDFCEPIDIKQLDVLGLETESEASVGTTISGTGASATLGGLTLSECGNLNPNMQVTGGNLVTNIANSCANQGNANYELSGNTMVSTLYFKYRNPLGGCKYDKATFRIGTCVPYGANAIPVCPLTYVTYATDIVDYATNGPDFIGNDANAFQVMRDANGNFFNQNCSQIENEVNNGIAIPTVPVSPCAEVVEEIECTFCTLTPPCVACPMGSDYDLISLDQTGTNAAGLDEGIIEIDGVCIGSYEFEFSDLGVNEDGNGTTFGGFDTDGGTMILRLDFCDPLTVNQLDIRNLEVESQVSVGTTISGTGAGATLSGQTLLVCDDPSGRMGVGPAPNEVITDGPGCGANPNGSYTFGTNPVTTLYFKYHNPPSGCSYDYIGFRIGVCTTPPPMAVPVCPFEEVRVTCNMDDVIANGINNGNTDTYVIDGAGNYFDYTNCNATALINAFDNGTLLQTVNIGCAGMVETVEECVPAGCIIPTTCDATSCPTDSNFDRISLNQTGTSAGGFDIGDIELNNVCVGTYEFLFSDLDVSEDGNGTTFGGWDNDGGTMLLQLDFCDPIEITELDIRNLEVESEVSVGTTISGSGTAAILGGQTLTVCDDPSGRMGVGPAPNEVITGGPGCGANPNGTYTVGTNPVTTLYFKYHNPSGGCRGDYVGFRIGACVPTLPEAIPLCPLQEVESSVTKADGSVQTETLMQDANGLFFANGCPTTLPTTAVQTVAVSPCATVTPGALCTVCCTPSITCPNPGTFECGDDAGINAWLNSYMTEVCNIPGTSVSNTYDPANFPSCETTTLNITFSLMNAAGQTIADCVVALTINAAPLPTITCPSNIPPVACVDLANYVPPMAPYAGACLNGTVSGVITSSPPNPACGGIAVITYSGIDACGRTLAPITCEVTVLPAPAPTPASILFLNPISCEEATAFVAPPTL